MHLQECPRQDMNCPDCHTPLRRSELSEHSMICPDYIVKCHHASSGCAWTGARSSSSGHSLSCPYEAIGAFLTQHEDHVSVLTMENASLKHRVASLEGIVESFRSEMRVVKELLGPWTRSRAQARPSDPFSNLNNNVNEPILPRIQTGSTAFPGEPGSFESDFPDYLSPVGAHPPNQDLLASYFPPENNAPSGQPTPDYRHRSSQWLPGQGYTQSPRSMPHRLSASITSPVEPSAFMYPPESRHLSAPRLPQAPHIPPVHLHGTLEDSFDDLRESVVNLAATVTSLSQNTEMALASESLRLGEETVSLRSSVHGLRMQVSLIRTSARLCLAKEGSLITSFCFETFFFFFSINRFTALWLIATHRLLLPRIPVLLNMGGSAQLAFVLHVYRVARRRYMACTRACLPPQSSK